MIALFYLVYAVQTLIISFLVFYNLLSLFLFFAAALKIRKYLSDGKLSNLDLFYHHPGLPGVSFILPAYNEENAIVESIKSLKNLYYPKFEIIIVNDGSTDGTFRRVKNEFGFQRLSGYFEQPLGTKEVKGVYEMPESQYGNKKNIVRILLVDKENGGKADALNAGINLASQPYVCSMDADSLMDKHALLIGMRPFLDDPERIIGVGGQVGIANGCVVEKGRVVKVGIPKKAVELFQMVEYARSFVVGRTGLSALNSLIVLSGVFSVFRRDLVLKVGGYLTKRMKTDIGLRYCGATDTVCEDMEIVVRLYRYIQEQKIRGKVEYLPFPISWTEVPSAFRNLDRQRNRWYRGLGESLWFHKVMLLNPRFRQVGLFAMPYQFFFEFLGPLFEFCGYVSLPLFYLFGYLNETYFLLFCLVAIVFGMFLSVLTLLLGIWIGARYKTDYANYNIFISTGLKDILLLIFFALLSNIGYRQFILWSQTKGFIDFIKGKKSWEKFEHKGFSSKPFS